MKKILLVAALAFALTAQTSTVKAQVANCWYNGYKATLGIPPLTHNRVMEYPTFDYEYPGTGAHISWPVNESVTYLKFDTLHATDTLSLNVGLSVTAGATLYIQAGNDTVTRLVYLKQGSTPIDTISVTNHAIKRMYVFDGTLFQAFPK